MKRRAILATMGTTTVGLSGCLASDLIAKNAELSKVNYTPDGVSAVYEHFDSDSSYTNRVITDATTAGNLQLPEEATDFVEAIDFDDSYLVIAPMDVYVAQKISKVAVDELKRTDNEIHVDIHVHADGECDRDIQDKLMLIAVTSKKDPPASVSAKWFNVFQCNADYAPYHRLPDPVQREVDMALTEGQYETDSTLLYPEAVAEESILWKENDYYTSQIDDRDGSTVLTFESTSGESADSPATVRFYNSRSETLDITVVVTDDHGERLVDENLILDSHGKSVPLTTDEFVTIDTDSLPSVETIAAFDKYDLSIETTDGEGFTESFKLNPDHQDRLVVFLEDDKQYADIEMRSEFELKNDGHFAVGVCRWVGGWWGTGCGRD